MAVEVDIRDAEKGHLGNAKTIEVEKAEERPVPDLVDYAEERPDLLLGEVFRDPGDRGNDGHGAYGLSARNTQSVRLFVTSGFRRDWRLVRTGNSQLGLDGLSTGAEIPPGIRDRIRSRGDHREEVRRMSKRRGADNAIIHHLCAQDQATI